MAKHRRARKRSARTPVKAKPRFTARQGRYLAYLHQYRQLHGQGPSESEIARYLGVSPPSAHLMIVRLEGLGLVRRVPGARPRPLVSSPST